MACSDMAFNKYCVENPPFESRLRTALFLTKSQTTRSSRWNVPCAIKQKQTTEVDERKEGRAQSAINMEGISFTLPGVKGRGA